MSGLPSRPEDAVNGIDVREQGNALRVATNTPHLVSLGTGRLSTAVTLHPIKQGRVTIGSDPTCDIYVAGTGVCSLHCRVENSHAVVTLYPINGSTLLDGLPVDRATRLSQGSMLTIGRSNYLRFNHPEEAKLMKSVLPDAHLSMAPIQFTPNEECAVQPPPGFPPLRNDPQVSEAHYYQQTDAFKQKIFKDATLNALDRELDMTLKEMNRRKPPVAPRKPYRDLDQISDSNSDQDSLKSFGNVSTPPKPSSIMAKVSKFEYYAKSQQKTIGRSQFYTNEQNVDYSPKVFSSNSLTVNTPARDVLGGKNVPTNYKNADKKPQKMVLLNDSSNCSYANVMIKNKISKIDDIAKNFDDRSYDGVNLKKVNNVDSEKQTYNVNEQTYRVTDHSCKVNEQPYKENDSYRGNQSHKPHESYKPNDSYKENDQAYNVNDATYGKIMEVKKEVKYNQPSASFDRNPQFPSAHSSSTHTDRSTMAENMRLQAYRDRVEEQQQQEAESARLEEILNMCAEYERQITTGTPSTPTEKRSQNKIITNGSLPRSIGLNNPNFIQTSDGYFKFDTSQNRLQNSPMSKSLPLQRNLSNYENVDMHQILPAYLDSPKTPQILIRNPSNYENVGRMDEIGIPIAEDVTSPIMIRKLRSPQDFDRNNSTELPRIPNISTPLSSPYENVFYGKTASNFKPKSPNTQSPRTRIKTTFAHKNISPPQYFVFPTPPPIEDNSKMLPQSIKDRQDLVNQNVIRQTTDVQINGTLNSSFNTCYNSNQYYNNNKCSGIEKQLSLDEEIPMIDDSDLTNDLESRSSQISPDSKSEKLESPKSVEKIPDFSPLKNVPDFNHQNNLPDFNSPKYLPEFSPLNNVPDVNSLDNMPDLRRTEVKEMRKFEDMRKELIADIPELEEFERDLANNKREKILNKITNEMKNLTCVRASEESLSEDVDNYDDLRIRYDSLKESRRKVLSEIHELKSRMSEIRTQEDDILRELEMEKALIKGEYDSEIAILNIEQKNKKELIEKAKKVEEDIRAAKQKQEARQNELRERVEIATLQVERLEAALSGESTTSEELQNARDILDNETKLFEDLEFQHLEVESEMLAYREDLQNDIIALTKKIESQKSRILTLKSEANNNLTSALEETKVLQADYVQLLNKVEGLTATVQAYEKELKEMAPKLNLERAQSPLSSNSVENTQAETTDLDRSASSSDSDEINFEAHQKNLNDKFSSIDQMSQSMIVDLGEKRNINDLIDSVTMNKDVSENLDEISEESKTESQLTPTKEKKGFWERNFDSLTRLKRDKKKSPSPKSDIMSQSLNENMFFNNENIESDYGEFQKFNSLKLTKNKNKNKQNGLQVPVKSSSSSKIPTFSAFGKIIKKDSFGKKNKENGAISSDKENAQKNESESKNKNRFVKNSKSFNSENKYSKARQYTPDIEEDVNESGIETENERSSYADSLEGVIEDIPLENLLKIPKETPKDTELKSKINDHNRMLLRKSCGDEPGVLTISNDFSVALSETGKVPSQDDIDRISKVRINAPLVSSDADKNSLGRKTLDSLMEIERNRLTMLEEQGCQVIENEREKISELKRRVQNETKKLWESERVTKNVSSMTRTDDQNPNSSPSSVNKNDSSPTNFDSSLNNDLSVVSDSAVNDSVLTDDTTGTREVSHTREHSLNDGFDAVSAGTFPDNESSGVMSDSIEELQSRPAASVRRREDRSGRPQSDTSDVSNENTRSSLRVAPYFARTDLQRPLTRYLPIDREDLDLRHHIESAGHQVELCPHVIIDRTSCRGYLHKLGAKFHAWSKRWFVFDRDSKTFIYYSDKSEKKPRGGAYFQVIEEVYLDHGNSSKSPNPQTTFVVKTRQRRYYLMSPSGEAARIWIDVMFTGAQGYLEYLQ